MTSLPDPFTALWMTEDGVTRREVPLSALEDNGVPPDRAVTLRVSHSSLNYKDGMILNGNQGRLVRRFPHIPGIDMAGTVAESADPRWRPGDGVILTGWRVGELHWGGYAQCARVDGNWLTRRPANLSASQTMALGTAGLTAMLAVMALESNGLSPTVDAPVLVTGAAGGVGSIAVTLLSALGHEVAAVTGRAELSDWLRDLGATSIVPRAELATPSAKPLEPETWAGCVDVAGGAALARVLGQMRYGGAVAACGLAGGAALETTVLPLLLRAVRIIGIDSVMQPAEARARAWDRLAHTLPLKRLDDVTTVCALTDLAPRAKGILAGRVQGRTVVDVNA